jgi:hypothetical protein
MGLYSKMAKFDEVLEPRQLAIFLFEKVRFPRVFG